MFLVPEVNNKSVQSFKPKFDTFQSRSFETESGKTDVKLEKSKDISLFNVLIISAVIVGLVYYVNKSGY